MNSNNKRKYHVSDQEWATLANSRQQLEQLLPLTMTTPPAVAGPEGWQHQQQIEEQAAEINRLRSHVRHLQSQVQKLTDLPVIPSTSGDLLSQLSTWAELTPAWQNEDLGIRPWQAQPTPAQRRVQVELPHFTRR